jgi:hypothetical protein
MANNNKTRKTIVSKKQSKKPTNSVAAKLVLESSNSKLGNVSSTYSSIENSCPKSCSLKDKGCYAQLSFVGIHSSKLDKSNLDALGVARQEATLIKNAIKQGLNKRPLRLHVAGDCRTNAAAVKVSEATKGWNYPVWTYTHAWKDVRRSSWGNKISVLASVDKESDIKHAFAKGYVSAVVVKSFPNGKKAFKLGNYKAVPCPNQTHDNISCETCKLCWNDKKLKALKTIIAFEAHGVKRYSLPVVK